VKGLNYSSPTIIVLVMNTNMMEQTAAQRVRTREFDVTIDGVVELEDYIEPKDFFDGLLDVILEYIERHNGIAGLTMKHHPYEEIDEDFGDTNGEEDA
jgi:hypothetical protein